MSSKGRAFVQGLLFGGKTLFGHGPKCSATCACRAVEALADVTVDALEASVARSKRAKRPVKVEATRAVVVEVLGAGARRAEIVDAEIVDDEPVNRRSLPRGR